MPKYISTDNLIASGRDFLAGVKYIRARGDGKSTVSMGKILKFLADTVPAEDVTTFVYCKNCGKREKREDRFWCKPCGYRCNDETWFCPVGVRRMEDGK